MTVTKTVSTVKLPINQNINRFFDLFSILVGAKVQKFIHRLLTR